MENGLVDLTRRADTYKFLSECYYIPDEGLIQKVVDIEHTDTRFAELSSYVPPLVELELLIVDFTRLFVGPYKLLAPPYGSVYLEDGKFMGESTIDVRNCYESEGLNIVIKDAPDHIAMELEFMYYLIAKQIEAIKDSNPQEEQSCLRKQFSFLQTHLVRWLPKFAERVSKMSDSLFYREIAGLTEYVVLSDVEYLATVMNTLQHDVFADGR